MSYDVYCYRPESTEPDLREAESIVRGLKSADETGISLSEAAPGMKEKLAAALLAFNPRLKGFVFQYDRLAREQRISEDEARARYRHIELTAPEGDLAIQFSLYDDHASVSIPYWYVGRDANRIFAELPKYLRVLCDVGGFFAYDPQASIAFDPKKTTSPDDRVYNTIVREVPGFSPIHATKPAKTWWRFW